MKNQAHPTEVKAGVLDYKCLRKILSSYSKTELVDKKLDGKADRDFTTKRLDHTENMIEKILVTIDELWLLIRKKENQTANSRKTQSHR